MPYCSAWNCCYSNVQSLFSVPVGTCSPLVGSPTHSALYCLSSLSWDATFPQADFSYTSIPTDQYLVFCVSSSLDVIASSLMPGWGWGNVVFFPFGSIPPYNKLSAVVSYPPLCTNVDTVAGAITLEEDCTEEKRPDLVVITFSREQDLLTAVCYQYMYSPNWEMDGWFTYTARI